MKMISKKKNMLRRILYTYIVSISTLAIADICTDDYIISGGRSIILLPDIPFEILESKTSLFVRRGTLILEFTKPENIFDNEQLIKRYSLEFIGDTYYFDLLSTKDSTQKKWKQYANEPSKRGFGGECKAD
jgi:hypothetical protein